ncbi:MAG: aquaporin family protein [Candidatus Marinimicrobia bacterium]|mgnify:CR=1 FL=1|nr:aquaporin family protein [Candidatus Neomarinimicrobiota bacterium]|tara:strand:+ start:1952 stop:2593 length:642 start_codon:yes stop_codon:yes gene_type:complete
MKYLAESLGTFFLVAVVVGSGIMAENLANGNNAVALLGNTIATGAILFVLIKMFGSISGAHFNPAVSLVFYLRRELNKKDLLNYIIIQVLSGLIAVISIHYIFQIDLFQVSSNIRGEFPLLVSEIIATFGLVLTILLIRENDEKSVAIGVALFITAGYWFTSSTSFANPAVTISRIFTNTFTGIAPESLLYFLSGQLIGCTIANYTFNLFKKN